MRQGSNTSKRFAQYVRPIELLEKAFSLAGLEVEYAATCVGYEDFKAFEIFYYPILSRAPSIPWGFEGMGPAETLSDMAFWALRFNPLPSYALKEKIEDSDMERIEGGRKFRVPIGCSRGYAYWQTVRHNGAGL